MFLEGMGFDSKHDFAPPTVLLGLLLCPWTEGIFFGGTQHSFVDDCSAEYCNFGVLAGEDEHTSFYFAIFPALFRDDRTDDDNVFESHHEVTTRDAGPMSNSDFKTAHARTSTGHLMGCFFLSLNEDPHSPTCWVSCQLRQLYS